MTRPGTGPRRRFAVVIRLFQWDDFIRRQVERYAAVSTGGDLFLSVDETNGPVRTDGGTAAFRTTNADLLGLGLADRYGRGSLIWWNSDYPNYAFASAYPDYDYYVFVEYDSLIRAPVAQLIENAARQELDLVVGRLREPGEEWFWLPHARLAYPHGPLHASLNCVMVISAPALRHLHARRLAMGADDSVRHWPIGEAFVATEAMRGGFRCATLDALGDASAFEWFPPVLESALAGIGSPVFIHPVLDAARARQSVIRNTTDWRAFLDRGSLARRILATSPSGVDVLTLARAGWRSFATAKSSHRWRRDLETGLAPGW